MHNVASHLSDTYEIHVGIVLRYVAATSRIVVFDCAYGKYTGICFSSIAAGSCIMYELSGAGAHKKITIREVVYMPLVLARSHLTFLHHILELCDIGLPLENVDRPVFSLLLWISAEKQVLLSEYQQDLIVAKLLVSLGLHTSDTSLCHACIALLHTSSVDTIMSITLDSKCAEKIHYWIYQCLCEQLPTSCLKIQMFFKKRIGPA